MKEIPPPSAEVWAKFRERFWTLVEKQPGAGCWLFNGVLQHGYGRMHVSGKTYGAHRLSLMDQGVELPPGMVVDHICRTRNCVRPDHLRVVTSRVNALENTLSPAALNAVLTHCPKGHPYEGPNLVRRGHSRFCRACKRESDAAIRERRMGDIWRVAESLPLTVDADYLPGRPEAEGYLIDSRTKDDVWRCGHAHRTRLASKGKTALDFARQCARKELERRATVAMGDSIRKSRDKWTEKRRLATPDSAASPTGEAK